MRRRSFPAIFDAALVVLVLGVASACGGGGGGGSRTLTEDDCADATPILDSDDNRCRAPGNNAECESVNAAMPIYDSGDNSCRPPENNTECRNVNPAMPVFDRDRGMCTLPVDDCLLGQILDSGSNACEPPDDDAECERLNPDEPIFDSGDNMCRPPRTDNECERLNPDEPIYDTGGDTCRPPRTNAECRNVNAAMPIFDSTIGQMGECRARQSDDCPVGQVRDSDNNRCRRPEDSTECAEAGGGTPIYDSDDETCRRPRTSDECAEAGGSTPIYDSDDGMCRAREERDCEDPTPILGSISNMCEMPDDDAECARVNAATPIYDSVSNACEPPDDDAECARVNAAAPIYDSGNNSCRPPGTNTECASLNADEPIYDSDDGMCRPRQEGDCEDPTPVFDSGTRACIEIPGLRAGHRRPLLAHGFSLPPTDEEEAAHALREAAADDTPLSESDEGDVTQGSATTSDRVYFTGFARGGPTGATIDVGNNVPTATPDLVSDSTPDPQPPASTDRRTGFGVAGAEDPVWDYTTTDFNLGGNNAANEFGAHIVDFSSGHDAGGYLGGGVWSRRGAGGVVAVGAFVDGETPTLTAAVLAAAGTATYRGHSYGRYTTLPAALTGGGAAEPNIGFFAAKAMLTANFGATPTISGTITEFLFSTGNGFTSGQESALEDVIGGSGSNRLSIRLASGSITGNRVAEETSSDGLMVGASGAQTELELTGRWGGRFYGTPATGDAPQLVGGVWGATGQSGDPALNGFGLSLIGAFGAGVDRIIDLPDTMFTGAADANYAAYVAAAGNPALFADGLATASGITQGSAATPDRVYLDFRLAPDAGIDRGLFIDVGNDGPTTPNLASTGTEQLLSSNRGRRGGLGRAGDAEDPVWNTTEHKFTRRVVNDDADAFEAYSVGWSNDVGNRVSGGVWSRVITGGVAVGAFVDGENPTEMTELTAATGTATYRGHAYGRASLNNAVAPDADNPGFFAAKAVLNANFGTDTQGGTISGRISNFLFSERNGFTDGQKSALEDLIGGAEGLTIRLGAAGLGGNMFGGTARSDGIRLPGGMRLELTGRWSGRFYGTPARSGNVPQVIGGIWGVADSAGGVSFSLIGTFGAGYDGIIDLPFNTVFAGPTGDNHPAYVAAARNFTLFGNGNSGASSVTQGARRTNEDNPPDSGNRTSDRVFLTIDSGAPTMLTIDVGNGGMLVSDTSDDTPIIVETPDEDDRRTGTVLGTTLTRANPVWNYTIRTFTKGGSPFTAAGEFEAHIVDWSSDSDAGGYLGGGVWSYNYLDTDGITTLTAVGAFVDGGNPTGTGTGAGSLRNATGIATYRGHAYGRTSLNNAVAPDADNPGFFAAKATLNANFNPVPGSQNGAISGRIDTFLFSTNNGFTDPSALESLVGGAERFFVTLEEAGIGENRFNNTARSSGIRLPDGRLLESTGRWGGRFYGTPENRDAPQLVGGTFGIADATADNSVSFSLIGAFGAGYDETVILTPGLLSPRLPPNHAAYVAASGHLPLFGDGQFGTEATLSPTRRVASSVTQGALGDGSGRTRDRVFLRLISERFPSLQNLVIDVGNDGDTTTNLISLTLTASQSDLDAMGAMDRRTTTDDLGVGGDEDPAWKYTTNFYGAGSGNNEVNDFRGWFVNWFSGMDEGGNNNYLAGGVWTYNYMEGPNVVRAVGAFVDGSNPTEIEEVQDATGTATYRGHASGRISSEHGVDGDTNPHFFAAKATLNADFTSDKITGRIDTFLFSKDAGFQAEQESDLEQPIGGPDGLIIHLREARITGNELSGITESSTIRLGERDIFDLTGQWGGRFYGTPAEDSGDAPELVGGTFGAAGSSESFSLSIIGSFGARKR